MDSSTKDPIRGAVTISQPREFTVDPHSVQRFRSAVAEEWDRFQEPPSLAPPTYFCPDPIVTAVALGLHRPMPLPRTIDGGSEWEVYAPVFVGDTLTRVARIASQDERATASKRLVTTVMEVRAWNQNGELVGIARGNSVSYEDLDHAGG